MSNIQTGAERMPHDLSHLGFLAGQIGRLITISTTPVIAGDSFEMDAVGALRLSPLRRGLAIDSTVDIFTFYVPHRHVYGEQWIKFMKDGVNATPLPTVNTTGYIDHAAFLGTINPDTNKIPKHLSQGYLNIYNNYFKAPWMHEFRTLEDIQEFAIMGGAGFPDPYAFSRRVYKQLRHRRHEFDLVHDNQCLGRGLLSFVRDGWPFVHTLHHPITVDRDLELAHATSLHRR